MTAEKFFVKWAPSLKYFLEVGGWGVGVLYIETQ